MKKIFMEVCMKMDILNKLVVFIYDFFYSIVVVSKFKRILKRFKYIKIFVGV